MASTSTIDQLIPKEISKLAYETLQQGKASFSLAHKRLTNNLTNLFVQSQEKKTKPLSAETLQKLSQKRDELMRIDWEDAELGIYPISLLFNEEWLDFFRYYPAIWLDMPNVWQKTENKEYHQFSSEIDKEGYPSYYLQNFHNQTNGYLSDMSANLYDFQVEILFSGMANPMRRRILAPLKQNLSRFEDLPPQSMKVLDVACGSGYTLKLIRATLPKASLFGTDLSPAYLRKANQLLSEIPGELPQLLQANSEELPYQDNYFHGVTSVFLFHELPPNARQKVIEESFRVVKPGGVFIICDSIQILDYPEFETILENFPAMFHEPYYKSYVKDDLVERLKLAGFDNIETQQHFMSKYLIAYKPL